MASWAKVRPGDAVIGGGGPYTDRYTGTVTQVVKASRAMTLVQIEGRDKKIGETGLFWLFADELRRAETRRRNGETSRGMRDGFK